MTGKLALIAVVLTLHLISTDTLGVDSPSGHESLIHPRKQITDSWSELCAFCHFPKGGSAQNPSWIRNEQASSDRFQTFPTTGISFPSEEAEDTIGSVSMACLSCHDGTAAKDIAVVHRGQFSHPVGVPYAGRGYDFHGEETILYGSDTGGREYAEPARDLINEVPVWWVESGITGRQKSDLQLYSRIDKTDNQAAPYVECSTCHDPHSRDYMYLRMPNSGSELCRVCHRV